MITRSEKQIERDRIARKVAKMPQRKGTWHKVDHRNTIFVREGRDPDERIEKFKKKHGI